MTIARAHTKTRAQKLAELRRGIAGAVEVS